MSSPEPSDVFEKEFVHEEDVGHSFDSSDKDGELRGYYFSTSIDEEEHEKSSWTAEYALKTSNSRVTLALNVPTSRLCIISSVMRIGSLPSLWKDEEYFCSCVQELNARGEEVDVYKIVKDGYDNEEFEECVLITIIEELSNRVEEEQIGERMLHIKGDRDLKLFRKSHSLLLQQ
ncbi:hypothetical protein OROHE_006704 [Orobanche hederae]